MTRLFLALISAAVLGGCMMQQPEPLPTLDGNGEATATVEVVTEPGVLWIGQCGGGGVFGALGAVLFGCPPTTPCDHGNRFCCMNPGHPQCQGPRQAQAQGQRPGGMMPNGMHPKYAPMHEGQPTYGFDRLRFGDEIVGYRGTVDCSRYDRCYETDARCIAEKRQCEGVKRVLEDEHNLRRQAAQQYGDAIYDWTYCCQGGPDRSRCPEDLDCSQPPQFIDQGGR